jgi:signal transduction histidine kinase
MKRMRSPSLFVTFTASFLGVLALAALLQFLAAFGVLRSEFTRGEKARATLLVQDVALKIAALSEQDRAQLAVPLLRAHADNADSLLIVYRDADGRIETSRRLPGSLRYGIGEMLAGRPFATRSGRRRNRRGGPGNQDAQPPGLERPENAAGPDERRPSPAPFAWRAEPRLEIVARATVQTDGSTLGETAVATSAAGEVAAVRPMHRLGWGPAPRRGTQLLLLLPLALVIAGAAGALMFRSVVRRVRRLEAFAARVADGDLQARIEEPGADELGRLGEQLNSMASRLQAARQQETEADQQRRQLFADITHELATPLTSIRGYTETILHANPALDASDQATALQHVFEDAQRMDRLLQDLLELTRLEAGAVEWTLERLNWTSLCHNTMTRLQPQFQEAGLDIRWDGPRTDTWIEADGRRMEQVAENLLTNALRYVPPGGTVLLSMRDLRPDAGVCRLCVADDGPGFPPEDLPRVFERFYRGRHQEGAPQVHHS